MTPIVQPSRAPAGILKGHHRTRRAISGIHPGPLSKTWPRNFSTAAMHPRKPLQPARKPAREGHLPQPMIVSRAPHRLNGGLLAPPGKNWGKARRRIGLPMCKRRNEKACLRPTAMCYQILQAASREGTQTSCIVAPFPQRKRTTGMHLCTSIR